MSRLLDAKPNSKEDVLDSSLRPLSLKEYVGQEDFKKNLKIFIGAAKHRNECLDHILLYGPPGLGKTTLAHVIAHEMGANIKVITGTSIEKAGDLAAILLELEAGDILFIDEIHRIPRVVEESLYSAMEDFRFDIMTQKDTSKRAISFTLPPFTLIGATTRAGDLSSPLRTRFGITGKLNFYTEDEIKKIVLRTSKVLKTEIDDEGATEISKRSRGTPRIANRLFKRVRDFVNYEGKNEITYNDALDSLEALKVDSIGLDDVDIRYLKTLIERFKGGPVGLDTLANAIGESK